jgi:hypothetical protein
MVLQDQQHDNEETKSHTTRKSRPRAKFVAAPNQKLRATFASNSGRPAFGLSVESASSAILDSFLWNKNHNWKHQEYRINAASFKSIKGFFIFYFSRLIG